MMVKTKAVPVDNGPTIYKTRASDDRISVFMKIAVKQKHY
jgi:hypothetical protein